MLSPGKRSPLLWERYSSFLLLLSPPEPSFVANPPPLEATNSTRPVSLLSPSPLPPQPLPSAPQPAPIRPLRKRPGVPELRVHRRAVLRVLPRRRRRAACLSGRGSGGRGEDCSFALKWVPFSFRARNVVIFEARGGGWGAGGRGGGGRGLGGLGGLGCGGGRGGRCGKTVIR